MTSLKIFKVIIFDCRVSHCFSSLEIFYILYFADAKRPRSNDDEPPVSPSINGGRKATTGRLLYLDDDSDDEKTAEAESTPPRKKPSTKKDSPAPIKQSKNDKSPKTPNRRNQNSQNDKFSTPLQTVKRKPFNRLLEGVVIVLSGFQNPYRSDLRSKALQLGAKYKADWDSTCTHLMYE